MQSQKHLIKRFYFTSQTTALFTQVNNVPLSETTRVSWYQKGKTSLDVTEARDSE